MFPETHWRVKGRRSRSEESPSASQALWPGCLSPRPVRPTKESVRGRSCLPPLGHFLPHLLHLQTKTLPGFPSAYTTGTRGKAVIMAHDQLRFDLVDSVHCNTHYDQQRGAAKVETDPQTMRCPRRQRFKEPADEPDLVKSNARNQKGRHQGNNDEVECANQRDAG